MVNAARTDDWVALAFMERFLADRERGSPRTLEDYVALWPEHSDTIVREFRLIQRGEPPKTTVEEKASAGDGVPHHLGPYAIQEEIGRGGQAVVYLAEDTRLGRRVALKVLRTLPGIESHAALARFRREAMAASKVNHPAICGVHDVGQAEGLSYVAMPLITGESLAKRLPRERSLDKPMWSPFSSRDHLIAWFEEAASALHATHQVGVLHRDIKPGNLMVTPGERPVILDFGLAQEIDQDQRHLTLTGDILGTPSYLAPEQISGSRIPLDPRVDVWALGVTLYEVLTKIRPFDAPSRAETYRSIMTKDPVDPRALDPRVDRDLRAIVLTALEKDRDRRYQSALAFAEDLGRARRGEPVRARPAGPIYRLVRLARRHPMASGSLALALFFLVAGLITSLVLLGIANRSATNLATAQSRDQQRLTHMRELMRELASALGADLRMLPAAAGFRERLADRVVATLNAVSEAAAPEPELVREIAAALREKAETQASPHVPSQRDVAAARKTLAEARELMSKARETWPDSLDLVCEWVTIAVSSAQLEFTESRFAEILDIMDVLEPDLRRLQAHPGDYKAQRLICLALEMDADARLRTGDRKSARSQFVTCAERREALCLSSTATDVDRLDASLIWLKLAQVDVSGKRASEAITSIDLALRHAEFYAARHQDSAVAQDRLADIWRFRAYAATEQRDLPVAKLAWQMSAWFQEESARLASPGHPSVQDLLTAYKWVGRSAAADEDIGMERTATEAVIQAEAASGATSPARRVELARTLLTGPAIESTRTMRAMSYLRRAAAETDWKDPEIVAELAIAIARAGDARSADATARLAETLFGDQVPDHWKNRLSPLLTRGKE